jgi:hypothetical protein
VSDTKYEYVDGYLYTPDGSWTYRRHARGDVVALETIGFAAPLDAFYALTTL